MANNKNPNEKQPGENPEGKYHFNPGNMAGGRSSLDLVDWHTECEARFVR